MKLTRYASRLFPNDGNKTKTGTDSFLALQVAIITYENFFAFIEILSQHQAQRLATYVAESVLPKYINNLSLRRDSEAEFAAMQKKRATRSRRSSLMPIAMEQGSSALNGGQISTQASPLAVEGSSQNLQVGRVDCKSAREGKKSF